MRYTLTEHAKEAMAKRRIAAEWLERTLANPQRVETDVKDAALEHRLALIPEHGNRVLRVIVNTSLTPLRVVTLYFDRNMKGKL